MSKFLLFSLIPISLVCMSTKSDAAISIQCQQNFASKCQNEEYCESMGEYMKCYDGGIPNMASCKCNYLQPSKYICAAGYYGTTTTSGAPTCYPCPQPGTSIAGAQTINECYISTGTYTDNTGAFNISQKCQY